MVPIGWNYLTETDTDQSNFILLEDGQYLLLEEAPSDITMNNFLMINAGDGISVGDKIR